jgi:hypothetical protein
MRIDNDKIIFELGDIALLSPGLQHGLQKLAGFELGANGKLVPRPPTYSLDVAAARVLTSASKAVLSEQEPKFNEFLLALSVADPATKQQAQAFLDQAAAVVGKVILPATAGCKD